MRHRRIWGAIALLTAALTGCTLHTDDTGTDETTPVVYPDNGVVEVRVEKVDLKDDRPWYRVEIVTLDQYHEYAKDAPDGVAGPYKADQVFKGLTLDTDGNDYGVTIRDTSLGSSPSPSHGSCESDPYRCNWRLMWLVGLAVADRDSKVTVIVSGSKEFGPDMEVELQ